MKKRTIIIVVALVVLILFLAGLWIANSYESRLDNSKECKFETINNSVYCVPEGGCKTYYASTSDNISYCMAK